LKAKIIVDTNILNKLVDDSDSEHLLTALRVAFFIRLTETNISEIVATTQSERRHRLLDAAQKLLAEGECIYPYNWIVEHQASTYLAAKSEFDWTKLDVRFRNCEREIVRRQYVDDVSGEQREEARRAAREFNESYTRVRPSIQSYFSTNARSIPRLNEYLDNFTAGDGPIWGVGRMLVETPERQIDDSTLRDFYNRCPPFRALLLALTVSEYERCLRAEQEGDSCRADRFDVLMSAYLPYCDDFITADEKQLRCFQAVVDKGNLLTRVRSYDEFRRAIASPLAGALD
jgi:hypothetical protein